jgi:hypothetical protein
MAMPTTMQLVAKHTQSLKQRVMYEIVRMMRSNGITIAELTTYEAEHVETADVLQAIRKKMKLAMMVQQSKDAGIIKATANSVYTRSGAKAAAEYLKAVGLENEVSTYFDNPSRANSVSSEVARLNDPTPSNRNSPAVIKSHIVKSLTTTTTDTPPPLPTEVVSTLDEEAEDTASTKVTTRKSKTSTKRVEPKTAERSEHGKVDLADDMPED